MRVSTLFSMFFTPMLSFSTIAYANNTGFEHCMALASTKLERAFCQVQKAAPNNKLPNIEDFKKNPPKVQRLLIKRDAKKYGIPLPSKTVRAPKKTPTPKVSSTAHVLPSLVECQFKQDLIRCNQEHYTLVGNKKNKQLKPGAFSEQNQLLLPHKLDTRFKDDTDFRYLSDIYPKYIYKMLDIGLGDSTMSLTKFAAVYWQSKNDKLDFSERFKFMYDKLKTEKSRNQIQTRYRDNYPVGLHQCMRLDKKVIVCDDMKQNWVYKLR